MTAGANDEARRPPARGYADPGDYARLTEDDLVTGEAVALDLPAAGLGTRLVSGLIDATLTFVLLLVVMLVLLLATSGTDDALMWAASVLSTALALVAFPATLETLTRGRSVGKLAMGLRVVRDDAGAISFQHAFVRALLGTVEIYALTGVPAVLVAMISPRGKRLGDYAAGTYVVRDRVPLRLPHPVPMPPPLAGWAARADVAALPPGLALAVRRFLLDPGTDPVSRSSVANRLAGQVAAYVSPPAPPGTPPDAFLAAVAATRRERDAARLRREAELRHRLTSRSRR